MQNVAVKPIYASAAEDLENMWEGNAMCSILEERKWKKEHILSQLESSSCLIFIHGIPSFALKFSILVFGIVLNWILSTMDRSFRQAFERDS